MARLGIANPASRLAAFSKRRAGLFKKAHELAVLCNAEVAIIIISAEGRIYEFASSNMGSILRRVRMCLESGNRRALQFKAEVLKEVGVPKQMADKLKLRRFLDEDIADMNRHEAILLEETLNTGMLFIKDTKMKLLMVELEESRMQEQQVLQKNQFLLRQVEHLQGMVPQIYYPMPISAHYPAMGHDSRPGDREFLPWTSFAAPLAITAVPETQGNLHDAADKTSLPSTSFVANDFGRQTKHNIPSADEDSLAIDNSNNLSLQINTSKPSLHWLPHEVIGAQSRTCLS